MELYKKHRPTDLSELIGQDRVVNALASMLATNELPHALLFTGGSGTGKTTTARILKTELQCADIAYSELNVANEGGIDMVRDLQSSAAYPPLEGDCSIFVLDECQSLTPNAQEGLLKLLEDTPDHAYFVLVTTNPSKLRRTIRTRCTEFKFSDLSPGDAMTLLEQVLEKEESLIEEEVLDKIVELAQGSARELLVLLHSVLANDGGTAEEHLEVLVKSQMEAAAIDIARLLHSPHGSFPKVAKLLKTLEEDPEGVRHIILSYANSVLLGGKGNAQRAYAVIESFRDTFYDSKKAGLSAACFEVFNR